VNGEIETRRRRKLSVGHVENGGKKVSGQGLLLIDLCRPVTYDSLTALTHWVSTTT